MGQVDQAPLAADIIRVTSRYDKDLVAHRFADTQ
jgi:hypothetical protein